MNDFFLVAALPLLAVVLVAVYKITDIWLENRDSCAHTWSRWTDPQKGEGHPYQTRSCNKCNLHQSRIVQ
jgi:hypothetical protein